MSARPSPRAALAALALCLLAGCASVPPAAGGAAPAAASPRAATPGDPWEAWNRKVAGFNDAVDSAVLKPVAQAYVEVVPRPVRQALGNFIGNLGDVWSAANHFLQGKFQGGLEMGMRVLANTVLGAGGFADPATEMRLERRSEDFGQTLAVWGAGQGPYLVLPLLGPSTVRDSAGLVADRLAGPAELLDLRAGRDTFALTALELVNIRAELLAAAALLDQVALDRYSFVRDAYLSRRKDAIFDGAPPMDTFDDEEPAEAAKKPQPATRQP